MLFVFKMFCRPKGVGRYLSTCLDNETILAGILWKLRKLKFEGPFLALVAPKTLGGALEMYFYAHGCKLQTTEYPDPFMHLRNQGLKRIMCLEAHLDNSQISLLVEHPFLPFNILL